MVKKTRFLTIFWPKNPVFGPEMGIIFEIIVPQYSLFGYCHVRCISVVSV